MRNSGAVSNFGDNPMAQYNTLASLKKMMNAEEKKPTIILLLGTILLVTWKYYGSKAFYFRHLTGDFSLFSNLSMTAEWYTYLTAFVLLGLSALLIIKYVFHEPLADYGLQAGDVKFWVPAVIVIGVVMAGLSYLSSKDPQFITEYPLYKGAGESAPIFIVHAIGYLTFYIGWEIFFRGFMQFGLRSRFGDWGAILVQTALSCVMHIGKPDGEIYSSILGALVWGLLVYRSRSIYPAIATHWILGIALDFFIVFH